MPSRKASHGRNSTQILRTNQEFLPGFIGLFEMGAGGLGDICLDGLTEPPPQEFDPFLEVDSPLAFRKRVFFPREYGLHLVQQKAGEDRIPQNRR
jgi:hypothetical protein